MEEIYQNSYFEDLLTKYEKLVFSICYRMTNNYFDAQDLTQETFISVYKVMESFDAVSYTHLDVYKRQEQKR